MNPEPDRKSMEQIVVIGPGYWGVNHVRNFHELGALGMVCDTSHPSLERIAKKFPDIRIENDFRSALSDANVRGVVIATPAESHYRIALQAIEAGKDVLVEKPLTLDVAEGEHLVKLAGERGSILMVGHLPEYHPAVFRLRDFI